MLNYTNLNVIVYKAIATISLDCVNVRQSRKRKQVHDNFTQLTDVGATMATTQL